MGDRAERRTRGAGQRELASSPLRGAGYEGVASPAAPRSLVRGGAAASAVAAVPSPPPPSLRPAAPPVAVAGGDLTAPAPIVQPEDPSPLVAGALAPVLQPDPAPGIAALGADPVQHAGPDGPAPAPVRAGLAAPANTGMLEVADAPTAPANANIIANSPENLTANETRFSASA